MIDESSRVPQDEDVLGGQANYADPHIEYGTAGWADQDAVEDLGDGSEGTNGRTLIRVTLFTGRDITKAPKRGVAGGRPVLVQLMAPLYVIPPKDALVVVIFPGGDFVTPGAGVLLPGWIQTSPTAQFRATRAVLDVGADVDLVLRAKSITLQDHGEAETPQRFGCWLTIGPSPTGGAPGVIANDAKGGGFVISGGTVGIFGTDGASPPDAKAVLQLNKNEVRLLLKGAGYLSIKANGDTWLHSQGQHFSTYARGAFGPIVTTALAAAIGPQPGLVSTSTFIGL